MKRVFLFLFVSLMLNVSSVFAQTNYFTPEDFNCDANCNLFFSVTLDGEALASSNIEVGAFVDDVCRQTARLGDGANGNYTFGSMQIPHDGVVTVTFKMYDHATEVEYDDCSTTITTESGEEILGLDENFSLDAVVIAFTSSNVEPTGPEYPWVPVVGTYADQMGIDAIIQINGVTVTEDTWEVGVFCGDECRGDQKGFIQGPNGPLMMIPVSGQNGDILNFYLYDMATNSQHPGVCSTTVTFEADETAGSLMDPIILNFVTLQTFTKDIAAYTENGGYYLIATPIGEVSPENVTNMLANNYDLYYFNQSQDLEWVNFKEGEGSSDPGFNLMPGMGYLYANSENVTLTFTGVPYESNGEVTLYKDDNADFAGWNLVGNPFAQTAYINKPFYTMNDDGSEVVAGEGNEIGAMEGIFVVAEEDEETVTFSTEPIEAKSQIVLNVSKDDRGNVIDRAVVRIGQSELLPKFMLNPTNTKMYISKNGNDYSVVRSNKSDKLPVNFEPAEDGTYTININVENANLKYLHLIDRLAGVDLDMLQNSSYRFEAKTKDKPNRFVLEFKVANNPFHQLVVKDDTNTFGFFSNGEWIINNEGDAILQVVDVNGQILSNEEINGCVSKHIEAAPGVYMLRLIKGKDIKVQKIVIK